MTFNLFASGLLAFALLCVQAAPAALAPRTVSTLSTTQVSSYKPYSWYAAAGYCSPASTLAWNCGTNCNANAGFKPVASGGDGNAVQFWYVGYDPTLKTIIVAHQGTDPSEILSILTDADFFLDNFDSTLFPTLSTSIQAHNGFLDEHAKTATTILAAVQKTMTTYSSTSVTIVGHSLGAALALIESVYLPLHLPTTTTFKTIAYSLPRVGNQAFADYVDAHTQSLVHINNKRDIVPIIPGRTLGFHHPSGEVHIQPSNSWLACSGQDDTENLCTIATVPNILVGDIGDHEGPFDGVTIAC